MKLTSKCHSMNSMVKRTGMHNTQICKKKEDINRLMEVINMIKIRKDAKQIIEEMRQEAREEGRQEGRQEGKLDLTRKFA